MFAKAKITLVAALLGASLNVVAHDHASHGGVEMAVKSDTRSKDNMARDAYRNPKDTLSFFGLKPGMTVVEIWPGGGWYTEILAPAIGPKGTLYAAHFPVDSEVGYFKKSRMRFEEKMKSHDAYKNVTLTNFVPMVDHAIAPAGSADMVLTFRNVHNWYMQKDEEGVAESFKAFFAALKPGGVLGVVDHRLPEDRDAAAEKRSGYVKESWVIALAEQAGFKLAEKSAINANSKDTANHPKGVWTLPPRLALGEEDKAKYLAIGESDRMTLKFIKPTQG